VAVGALPLLTACSSSDEGRALRPPDPDQTTTTAPTSLPATTVAPLRLSSGTMAEGGEVPVDHTCRGRDVSPPLQWTGVPSGTVELAVVVRDVDAGGFVHWVIAGLASDVGGVAEGTPPAGAVEATNDFARPGWAGPCPVTGVHNYEIRLYALSQPSGVTAGQPGAAAAAQVEATPALMSAVLSARATPVSSAP
jgi:hypothetical protein